MFSDLLHNIAVLFFKVLYFKTKFKIRQIIFTLVFDDSKELRANFNKKNNWITL